MGALTHYTWEGDERARAEVRAISARAGMALTVRSFYYQLLSRHVISLRPGDDASADAAYKKVGRLLTDMRQDGDLEWAAVSDPSRRKVTHPSRTLRDQTYVLANAEFHVDIWRGQPRKLEVWVEKDAMLDTVNSLVAHLRIPVYTAKGYSSQTLLKKTADRFGSGKGWTVLYLHDFDPSGLDCVRSMRDVLKGHGCRPEIVRVALTEEDTATMEDFAVLVKEKDTRADAYRKRYGERAWELDALDPPLLRQRLTDAIDRYFDHEAFQAARAVEAAVQQQLHDELEETLDWVTDRLLDEGAQGDDDSQVWVYGQGYVTVPDLATQRLYLGEEAA